MTRHHHDRRSVLRATGLTVGLLATAGCLGRGSTAPEPVEMVDVRFVPSTLRVPAGTTVRWENVSDIEHTVTAYENRIPDGAAYFASGGFESEQAARNDVTGGLIDPGGSYDHAFERPGTYDYFCIPHEGSGMRGSIEVR